MGFGGSTALLQQAIPAPAPAGMTKMMLSDICQSNLTTRPSSVIPAQAGIPPSPGKGRRPNHLKRNATRRISRASNWMFNPCHHSALLNPSSRRQPESALRGAAVPPPDHLTRKPCRLAGRPSGSITAGRQPMRPSCHRRPQHKHLLADIRQPAAGSSSDRQGQRSEPEQWPTFVVPGTAEPADAGGCAKSVAMPQPCGHFTCHPRLHPAIPAQAGI